MIKRFEISRIPKQHQNAALKKKIVIMKTKTKNIKYTKKIRKEQDISFAGPNSQRSIFDCIRNTLRSIPDLFLSYL